MLLSEAMIHGMLSTRNLPIELLRVCAIIGIAIFHTFAPAFQQATAATPAITMPAPALWLLGIMMILGSWGNHVFFMISGYFLIPQSMRHVDEAGYWKTQYQCAGRRALMAAACVAFYAILAFALRLPSAKSLGHWTIGLEFVWLYCAFVLLAPAVAWCMCRLPDLVFRTGLIILLAIVYALNIGIAVNHGSSPASFALTDWQKWMSAVTYLFSFIVAGTLGSLQVTPSGLCRRITLALACTATLAAYALAVNLPTSALLPALSFKSTSPLAFILAATALMAAAGVNNPPHDDCSPFWRCIRFLAPGIIGFYIMQSATVEIWQPWFISTMAAVSEAGNALWFATGIVLSLGLVLTAVVFDQLIRRPLLHSINLAK